MLDVLFIWIYFVEDDICIRFVAGCERNYLVVPSHSLEKANRVWSDAYVPLCNSPRLNLYWQHNVVGFAWLLLAMNQRLSNINHKSFLTSVVFATPQTNLSLFYF